VVVVVVVVIKVVVVVVTVVVVRVEVAAIVIKLLYVQHGTNYKLCKNETKRKHLFIYIL